MVSSKIKSGKSECNSNLSKTKLEMFQENLKRADLSITGCQNDNYGRDSSDDHSMSTDHEAVSSAVHKAASSALKELQTTGGIKNASDDINRAMKHANDLEDTAREDTAISKANSPRCARPKSTRHRNVKEEKEEQTRMDAKKNWFHKIADKREKRLEERRRELGIAKPAGQPQSTQSFSNALYDPRCGGTQQQMVPVQMQAGQQMHQMPSMGGMMPQQMMPVPMQLMTHMPQGQMRPVQMVPTSSMPLQPMINPAVPMVANAPMMPLPVMPIMPVQQMPRPPVTKAMSQQSLLMQNHYQMMMNDRLLSSLNVPEHVRQAALRAPGSAGKLASNSAASSASSPSFNIPSFIGGQLAVPWRSPSEKSSSTEVPETPRSPPDLGMHSFAVWRS